MRTPSMPLQNFSVYDIIVDIVPGIVFGYLLWALLAPIENIGFADLGLVGVGQALLIVAVGFLIGRALHGGSAMFEFFVSKFCRFVARQISRNEKIEHYFKKLHNWYSNFLGPKWSLETVLHEALFPFSPFTFYTAIAYDFHLLLNEIYNVDFGQLDKKEGIEEFSYSLLYGKDTLYRKYEILSTGFRNTYLLFLVASILYASVTYNTLQTSNAILLRDTTPWVRYVHREPKIAVLIVGVFFALFVLFLHQRLKFGRKRSDALLFDSVIELEKKYNEESRE